VNKSSSPFKVGLIGAGPMGRKRADAVRSSSQSALSLVADVDEGRARMVASESKCPHSTRWQDVVARDDISVVIVSLPTYLLAPVTIAALQAGKHVLCEKPMARTAEEAQRMVEAARASGVTLKIGYNLRYHPAIWKAHQSLGALGELLFARCRYGHGGRPGYDKEWRCSPDLSGGGELQDQGVHGIDLFRWFLGDFASAQGVVATEFWDIKVDENAFAILKTAGGQVASLHASWTQWKNHFSLEVFGKDGYAVVEGLGGSYGVERLTLGKRALQGGPPTEERFEFPGEDRSCYAEWADFTSSLREGREPLATGYDGWQTLRIVNAVYRAAREGKSIAL